AAGRAAGEDRAVRAPDRAQHDLLRLGVHPELGHVETTGERAAEDAEHDALAVDGREHRDPQVHRLAGDVDRDAAVLRDAALRDVEAAHDLQPRDYGRLPRARDRRQLARDAVDADT